MIERPKRNALPGAACLDIAANRADARRQRIARDIFLRQSHQIFFALDQRHARPVHPARQREARCADARTKISGALACLRAAKRGEQNGVMPGAMALFRLVQHQASTEEGVARCRWVGIFSGFPHRPLRHPARHGTARNSAPRPASIRRLRAAISASSATRMRRGRMPSEPSITLIF